MKFKRGQKVYFTKCPAASLFVFQSHFFLIDKGEGIFVRYNKLNNKISYISIASETEEFLF